jgi:uncharacterized protein (TIGR03067 family)
MQVKEVIVNRTTTARPAGLLLFLALGLLLTVCPLNVAPAPAQGKDAAEADRKALQGTWRGWVVEGKSEKADRGPVHLELIIDGDRITAKRLEAATPLDLGEGTYRLSANGNVKTIDAKRTRAPGKGQSYAGIYAIEGDTFRWCVANPNQERPTELVTRRGQFLLILKRQK